MSYRVSSPPVKEPEPVIPFCDKYPCLHAASKATGKQAGIFGLGLVVISAIYGILWVLGWILRATGFVITTDATPNAVGGIFAIALLILVAGVGLITYLVGSLIAHSVIMYKITGKR